PDAGNAVEGHVRLQHGVVAGAQTCRVLPPVRRVADADRVADPGIFDDAVARDHAAPRRLHLRTGGARPGGAEGGAKAFDDDLRRVGQPLRRLTQMHGSRHRAVIALPRSRQLYDRRLAPLEWSVPAGQMWRAPSFAVR